MPLPTPSPRRPSGTSALPVALALLLLAPGPAPLPPGAGTSLRPAPLLQQARDTTLAARATRLLRGGRFEEAAGVFRRALARNPDDGESWYRYAFALHSLERFEAAAAAWKRADSLGFDPPSARYNTAAALARAGAGDSAFAALRRAVDAGFRRLSTLREDGDLDGLRDDPRFDEIVEAADRNAHPCRYDERRRRLDFWLGKWAVTGADGDRAGTNRIAKIQDGCALRESWTGAAGGEGESVNHFDPEGERWHQLWVDGAGRIFRYSGVFADGAMRLEGELTREDGSSVPSRMTLEPLPGGDVRQQIETREDGGGWSTWFEGMYEREDWARGEAGAPDGSPSLRYVVFHGGRRSGRWQEELFHDYRGGRPGLVTAFHPYDIYRSPVPDSLHDVVHEEPPPDVLGGPVGGVMRDHVADGLVADITDLWEEEGWDEAFPASLVRMSTVDGRRHFVPTAVQPNPIHYRPDVLQAAGVSPPGSWEELLAACRTLSDAGKVPFTAAMARWPPPAARWFTILDLRLNGPAFHLRLMRGEARWDGPAVERVFDRWSALFEAGCFTEESHENDYRTAVDELYGGEAAMWLIGEWVTEGADPADVDRLDFFPFPVLDPELPRGEIVHVYGASLPAGAKNREEARAFLSHLGSREVQRRILVGQDRLPARLDVSLDGAAPRHRKGRELLREIDVAVPLFELATHREVARAGLRSFRRFWADPTAATARSVMAELEEIRRRVYGDDDEGER